LQGGRSFLTAEQEEYIEAQRLSTKFKPVRGIRVPESGLRLRAFTVVNAWWFEVAILACIVANSVVMALSFFGEEDTYGQTLEFLNRGFALVFTLEAATKLLALGAQYFIEKWNCFDFIIVAGSLLGILATLVGSSGGGGGGFVSALRAFRLARIIRIIQGAKALRDMLNTLVFTVAGLVNVFGLLFLLFFIYAVMGVQLFAKVQFNDEINSDANFRSFGRAMLTLFRFATGENWNGFMYDLATAGHDNAADGLPVYDDERGKGEHSMSLMRYHTPACMLACVLACSLSVITKRPRSHVCVFL